MDLVDFFKRKNTGPAPDQMYTQPMFSMGGGQPTAYGDQKDGGGNNGVMDILNPFNDKNDFKPGKELAKDQAARWAAYQEALKTGNFDALGVPWAQQQQLMGAAQQQAMAGQQAAISELNRGALAGQAFQAGAFAEAADQSADKGADAAAKTAAQMSDLNQRMIQANMDKLRAEMLGLRDYRAEMVTQYLDDAMRAGGALGQALGPALAGLGPAGAAIGGIVGGAGTAASQIGQTMGEQQAAPLPGVQ